MMKKKVISLVLALVLIIPILSACSGGSSSETNMGNTSSTAPTSAPEVTPTEEPEANEEVLINADPSTEEGARKILQHWLNKHSLEGDNATIEKLLAHSEKQGYYEFSIQYGYTIKTDYGSTSRSATIAVFKETGEMFSTKLRNTSEISNPNPISFDPIKYEVIPADDNEYLQRIRTDIDECLYELIPIDEWYVIEFKIKEDMDGKIAEIKNKEAEEERKRQANPKYIDDKLEWVTQPIIKTDRNGLPYLMGEFKNISSKTIMSASIYFKFYDASGNLIKSRDPTSGEVYDSRNMLESWIEPGEVRRSEINYISDKATTFKIEKINY